jgi:CheY-like chemotaxis protein
MRQKNILVVEDVPLIAKVHDILLSNLKCVVTIAKTGAEAIAAYKQQSFDLVFMDLGLPDMDGVTVVKELREWEKTKQQYTPIVALTAHISDELRERALQAGMDDFFSKPLTSQIATKILNWVEAR